MTPKVTPVSPSSLSTVPAGNVRSCAWLASLSRSFLDSMENSGTLARTSCGVVMTRCYARDHLSAAVVQTLYQQGAPRRYKGLVVTCPRCGASRGDGDRFCEDCGAPLGRCPSCGEPVTPGKPFCRSCGQQLSDQPP